MPAPALRRSLSVSYGSTEHSYPAEAAAAAKQAEANRASFYEQPPPPPDASDDSSAVRMQSNYRGHKVRKEQAAAARRAKDQAAARMQASYRGQKVRAGHGQKKAAGLAEEPAAGLAEDEAATRMQASFRGHQTRTEQEEKRRVEWFNHYMLPDVANYEEALALAVTDAEIEQVYLAADAMAKADEGGICGMLASCFGSGSTPAEKAREADFTKAVREYDWDGALTLAATAEEKADVADSQNRVEWLEHYLAQGDRTQALTYAITQEEKDRVNLGAAQR